MPGNDEDSNAGGIEIRKWSEDMMGVEDIALMIGKKKTGKTTALMALAHHFRKLREGVAFCGSAGSYEKFRKVIPETYIYDEWSEKTFNSIINETQAENYMRKEKKEPKLHRFIFIDDFGFDNTFCTSKALKRALMNGRNDGMTPLFVSVQFPLEFKPAIRGQFDWVFLFRDVTPAIRKRYFDHYAGQIGNVKLFEDLFNSVTENRGCLVIRNCGTSNKIEDNFFWWKAPLRDWDENPKQPKWHMGSKKYWAYHFANYDPKWRKKQLVGPGAAGEKSKKRKRAQSSFKLKG